MEASRAVFPNVRLREEREQRGWSQKLVAAQIGAERYYISRWERGIVVPSAHYRTQLCALFGKNARELGFFHEPLNEQGTSHTASPPAPSPSSETPRLHWYVPHRRNPFFTGREHSLALIRARFSSNPPILQLPLALCGLGGMGKTQLALEYAYSYRAEYQAVLWLNIETRETLLAQCSFLAEMLAVSEEAKHDRDSLLTALKNWLALSTQWLLILDNVEDITLVKQILPIELSGHVLLTTRNQVLGTFAERICLEKMSPTEGALLLLRRARLLSIDQQNSHVPPPLHEAALTLAEALDGLPLALDQAAAYMDETKCGVLDFLALFRHYSVHLFHERVAFADHPESVVKTFAVAFEKIQQRDPGAADLLRLCAFLAPDTIPLDMLIAGAPALEHSLAQLLTHPLALNNAIASLRAYSLLERDAEKNVLLIHRLIQATLRDIFESTRLQFWSTLAVQLVNRAFPDSGEETAWTRCQQYLPQAQMCVALLEEQHIVTSEAGQLLTKIGGYLQERGLYVQAEQLLNKALILLQQTSGEHHLDMAHCLNERALLYHYQGNYVQAEQFGRKALALREELLGSEHLEVAASLNNLAGVLYEQGQYKQAEQLLQRILVLRENALGPQHLEIATALHNLAGVYRVQGKYAAAEPLMRRALAIREQALGPQHLRTLRTMGTLAALYIDQGKYKQAEMLHLQVLALREQAVGPHHLYLTNSLKNLASLYHEQGKLVEAEGRCQQALTICEQTVGLQHPDTLYCQNLLARIFIAQGNSLQAQPLCTRVLTLRQKTLEASHPLLAESYETLAGLYIYQGRYQQAEHVAHQALSIRETALGKAHPGFARSLSQLAEISYLQKDYLRAKDFCQQALTIYQCTFGAEHPKVHENLRLLASIYEVEGDTKQAQYLLSHTHQIEGREGQPTEEESSERNPLHPFLTACCTLQPQAWCRASDLWKSYQEWVQRNQERFPLHRRAFAHYLKMQGCQPGRTKAARIWRGIALS